MNLLPDPDTPAPPVPCLEWRNGRPTKVSMRAVGEWMLKHRPDLKAITEIKAMTPPERAFAMSCVLVVENQALREALSVVHLPVQDRTAEPVLQ